MDQRPAPFGRDQTNVAQYHRLFTSDGTIHKAKDGAVANSDFHQSPPDGTVAIDTTTHQLHLRADGAWYFLDLTAVNASLATAKGDLLVATAAATLARLGVGAYGQILTADSAQAAGINGAAGTNIFTKPAFFNSHRASPT